MKSFCQIALLVLLTLGLNVSCTKNDDSASNEIVGSWKVIYYVTAGNLSITKDDNPTWPEVNGGDITAIFEKPDATGKGTVSGIRVSNTYVGDYTIQKGGLISFGPTTSTEINEPEWTSLYNLNAVEAYEINEGTLILFGKDRLDAIVFQRN